MVDPVFEIFREEAREHLSRLEKGFLDLEAAPALQERPALIDDLFRHAHSLKGDARAVGLAELQQAAQVLENVLDDLRAKPETVSRSVINDGLSQLDEVRQAFEDWQSGEAGTRGGNGEAPAPAGDASPIPAKQTPPAVEPPKTEEPPHAAAAAGAVAAAEETFTVRVPSDRLDRMLAFAGEVRIAQRGGAVLSGRMADLRADLERLQKSISAERISAHVPRDGRAVKDRRHAIETVLEQVRRIESEFRDTRAREELLVEALEADIRRARLLPLMMLADSLRRAVRDLAQSLGKTIRYDVDVGQILLDKAVIEALREPLLHLVRNACDHGIEPPDERRAAGKPPTGAIRIHASCRGELIRMTIADDGRGINYERVRDRLRRRGGLTEAELNELPERELAKFLFQPGFTTADAGNISGRGVGLDVVFEAVRKLQGQVELASSSPAGTTFALTVPVTVSTVRILTVFSNGQYYGVPTASVVRTGRAKQDDLRELQGNLVLPIEGQPVRWVHLADLLETADTRPAANNDAWSYLLIAHEGRLAAVAVDDLEDESEVLLKPLGFPLGRLPGIVGGTIRPDGSVQVVLDLASSAFGKSAARAPRVSPRRQAARILIVDDSPTTRAILRNVFTAAGYSVRTATDGLDALERLRSGPADLVVSDVEMPRLNGFDLTRQVKAKFGVPVILVTGREKEEHRREGLAAGADAYVVKSTFQGQGLLEVVEQFV
jgi:two-component system chemotaxis sensor kinase CheA